MTDYEIPYIIVDKLPNSDIKFNFLLLKEYFKWDEPVCEHLLPEINIKELSKRHISSDIFFLKDYNEEETKNIINKGKKLVQNLQRHWCEVESKILLFGMEI